MAPFFASGSQSGLSTGASSEPQSPLGPALGELLSDTLLGETCPELLSISEADRLVWTSGEGRAIAL